MDFGASKKTKKRILGSSSRKLKLKLKKKGPTKKGSRSKGRGASTDSDDSFAAAARISSRNGKPLPNYNEDYGLGGSDDDPFEDELTKEAEAWKAVEGDEIDTIDAVLSHISPDGTAKEVPKENLLYTIKWKGYSHLHNTIENYGYLRDNCKGIKKVDNYIKTVWEPEQRVLKSDWATKEDIEAIQIERERRKELVESYQQVERVFAERIEGPTKDKNYDDLKYYCKWKELPYSEATWEVSAACRAYNTLAIEPDVDWSGSVIGRPSRICQAGDRLLPRALDLFHGTVAQRVVPKGSPEVHSHDGAARVHPTWLRVERVPNDRSQLVGLLVVQERERHPRRRNGPRQDNSNCRLVFVSGTCGPPVRTIPHRRSSVHATGLDDAV